MTGRWRPGRSTPLRLTAILIGVFTASTLLSFAAAYVVTRNAADAALHTQVSQEFSGYILETDQAGLERRVLSQVATIPQSSLILIYLGDNGRRIANVTRFPAVDGYAIVDGTEISGLRGKIADSYLAVSGRIGRGTLIMARSRQQVSELGEVFTSIFLISLLPTLGLAMATGALVARNARRRVEQIRGTLSALRDGDLSARVPPFAGGGDDLSEIGEAVNQMATAQAASVASLRQVSADIAHDLKTPIQRVSVMLEQIESAGDLNAAQERTLAQARAETAQIVRTFQSLLQIAQIEGGAAQAHFAPVDLAQVVGGVAEVYGPDAEENGQTLRFEVAGDGPFVVQGERNLLGQVAANLIENAMRHAGRPTAIGVTLLRADGKVALVVTDTGPGIPPEERENVLRRLYRLEQSRTSEGNGLGLSLVAAICDLHDADLALEDNAPGLRVRITFPAA